jgi:putative hydrolase of the HAD superfamily
MDGTVLDLRFDNFFWLEEVPRHYAARHGLEPSAALERLRPKLDAVRGTLDWYCVDYWSAELALDIVALKRGHRARIRYLPGALEFLAAARRRGKRVLLTTNAHPATLAIKDEQVGVAPHFDALISAHDVGAAKESSEFWPRLSVREALDPRTTLFVDDSSPVIDAARAARVGWIYQILQPDSTQALRVAPTGVAGIRSLADLLAALTGSRGASGHERRVGGTVNPGD